MASFESEQSCLTQKRLFPSNHRAYNGLATAPNNMRPVILAFVAVAAAGLFYLLRSSPENVGSSVEQESPAAVVTESSKTPPADTLNIEEAKTAFESLPLGEQNRAEALSTLAQRMAGSDIAAALTWADGLGVPSERISALSTIIAAGASSDAAGLAEAIEELGINVSSIGIMSSHSAVSELAKRLLDVWTPEKAFAWVDRNLTGEALRSNTSLMISELARVNPTAAVRRIESMANGPMRTEAIATLASGWAHDGSEALKYIETLADEDVRSRALERLAFSWVYSDKDEVIAKIDALRAGETRDALLSQLAAHVAQEAPLDAIGYADQIEGEARIAATRNLVRRWTEVAPEAAGDHVAEIEDPKERARLAGVLLKAWLQSEPAVAAAWASGYEGEGGVTVTKNFMAQWIHRDPAAASSWLGTLDPGPRRDAAIKVLIIHESSNDPEGALRWAETISDPGQRRQMTGWLKKELEKDE